MDVTGGNGGEGGGGKSADGGGMIAIFSRGRIDTSAADIVVDGGAGYQSGTAGGGSGTCYCEQI